MPNVGKSTLFKALTKKEVDISNYPFCTIEPNVGVVAVPDPRLHKLAELFHSEKIIPAVIKFVDIAGLVKGANKGEGLGNQFLSHIREVDAIMQIARCFEAPEIVHTENSINPIRDIEIINTELILKDLETAEKRMNNLTKEIKAGKKEALAEEEILKKIQTILNEGKLIYDSLTSFEKAQGPIIGQLIKQLQFLTAKPMIHILNSENKKSFGYAVSDNSLVINIKEELEISELQEEERRELAMEESVLPQLIKMSYDILNLVTFFTTGPDETRAWTIKKGAKAPEAAGVIHTDFEKKFIKAEAIKWDKLIEVGGFPQAGGQGLIRIEGKDYLVEDGDVITVKHG